MTGSSSHATARPSATPLVPDLVPIPGATFQMGSDRWRPDERPRRTVRLAPFRAARTPVTNAEYDRFLAATGHIRPPFRDDPRFAHPVQPVVGVSWEDAQAYAHWLATATELPLRLPTEAEREFAALGGAADTDWPWPTPPDTINALRPIVDAQGPHIPTAACANGYDLRCVAENVHEWCQDWYAPYDPAATDHPTGPPHGARRASRGGSWRHHVKFTRITARSSLDPTYRYNDYGFRLYANA